MFSEILLSSYSESENLVSFGFESKLKLGGNSQKLTTNEETKHLYEPKHVEEKHIKMMIGINLAIINKQLLWENVIT